VYPLPSWQSKQNGTRYNRPFAGCLQRESFADHIITPCHVVRPRMIDKDDWSVVGGDREPRVGGCEMKTCDRLALIPFDDVHEYREEDRGGNPAIGTSHEVEGGVAMCVS
jgi:hypothetical protein